MDNPYIFGPPIRRAEDFYGRSHETETILNRLRNTASVSVVGERRIGKTSLLYHLCEVIRSNRDDSAQMAPIIVNPQLPIKDESDFAGRVIRHLARALPELQLPRHPAPDTSALLVCLEEIAPKRLVLLIDEFEIMAHNASLSPEFYTALKGIAENYQVSIVTASRSPLADCCDQHSISSRFSDYFQNIFLGPFSHKELDGFVQETSEKSGVQLTDYLPQIWDLAGGFPAYTQLACMHYFEALVEPRSLAPENHQEIRQAFTYQVEPYFAHIWNDDLTKEERLLLAEIAQGRADVSGSTMHGLKRAGYVVAGHVFSSAFADLFLRGDSAPTPMLDRQPSAISGAAVDGIWLDHNGEVWRGGERITPPLTQLQYSLLAYLYKNRGRISSKYDIVEAVWSDDYIDDVEDHRISKLISRLRQRIEPTPSKPRFLITVHGRGYRLVV